MNARLLKEVEAERDAVTQLKAATDQHQRDNEASEKREERMGQMCNAMKAAERARAASKSLDSWATKEMEWAKEKANLLDAYEKCRQGLERAVQKLKEEKEKQATMGEKQRAARVKLNLKGCLPTASESGGESTGGPTQVAVERATPEPTWRPDRDGERSTGGGREGWSTVAAGSKPGGPHGQPRTANNRRRGGWTGGVPPTPGREGGDKEDPRPNTARWCEEIGQQQISSPLPGGV